MASSSSRRRADHGADDALEEGEYVPAYYSESDDGTDDDGSCGYSLQSRREEIHPMNSRFRGLADIVPVGRGAALPSPTPSFELQSDGTISDGDDGGHSPSSFGVAAPVTRAYACHVCGKEFGSSKAINGHMRVHDPHGRHGHEKEVKRYDVAVSGGWAATGRRGWTGSKGKAVVSSSDELNQYSMASAAAERDLPLDPTPIAYARSNLSSLSMASAKTNLVSAGESSSPQSIHNDPMAATVAAGPNPSTEAVVHQQPAAAAPPATQHGQLVFQLAPPAAAVQQGQLVSQQPAAPRREYTCKICGKSYPTHQGLGGHAAGHMNRRKEAEAAAAAAGISQDGSVIPAALRRGPRQQQDHPCRKCGKNFPTGVALGGHMRKHYEGEPIVHRTSKKRCVAPPVAPAALAPPAVCMADLTLALGIKTGQPSVSPAASGRVRLFGIDIVPMAEEAPTVQEGIDIGPKKAETPAVQEGIDNGQQAEATAVEEGSATTEDSAASTGGQLQERVEKSSMDMDSLSKEGSN